MEFVYAVPLLNTALAILVMFLIGATSLILINYLAPPLFAHWVATSDTRKREIAIQEERLTIDKNRADELSYLTYLQATTIQSAMSQACPYLAGENIPDWCDPFCKCDCEEEDFEHQNLRRIQSDILRDQIKQGEPMESHGIRMSHSAWEWLTEQPGGAGDAVRKLVDNARYGFIK